MRARERTKDERIKAEYSRLAKLFRGIQVEERAIIEPLLRNSAFMCITLQDLATSIAENGTTETYQNGANQSGIKTSAELNAYNTTIKGYLAIQKQLASSLPRGEGAKELEAGMSRIMKEIDG